MDEGSFAATRPTGRVARAPRNGHTLRLILANATRIGVQLLLIPVLARIIAPDAFGLVALATPLVVFTSILAEAGLVTGLVRSRVSPAVESSAFWFSAAGGLGCALILSLLAWPIALVARQPGLTVVLLALAPALVITCLTITPSARLQRTGALGAFAASEFLSCLAGAAVALWTALHGWGALSLVSQQLTLAGVRLVANMRLARFWPRLVFDFAQLRPVLALSAPLMGVNLLAYLSRSLDNLLIGLCIGPRALGFYATAYQSVQVPEFALGASVRTSAMPAIAHAPDRDTATGIYLKGLRTISLVATPLVIGCCLKAKGLVLLVLGPAWLPAAPLVAVLTPLGLLHAYFQLNTAALIGLGEVGVQLKLSVLTSVLGLIGIVAGMPWGSQGVAIGYAIGTVAAAAPYFRAVLTVLGAPWRSLVSGLGRASFAGAVMICALLLRAHLAPVRPAFWDLPESGLLGLGAYAVALLFLEVVRPAYLAPRARGLSVAQAQT